VHANDMKREYKANPDKWTVYFTRENLNAKWFKISAPLVTFDVINTFKLIHKKDEAIADAVIANSDVEKNIEIYEENEQSRQMDWMPLNDVFFKSYDKDYNYRLIIPTPPVTEKEIKEIINNNPLSNSVYHPSSEELLCDTQEFKGELGDVLVTSSMEDLDNLSISGEENDNGTGTSTSLNGCDCTDSIACNGGVEEVHSEVDHEKELQDSFLDTDVDDLPGVFRVTEVESDEADNNGGSTDYYKFDKNLT